MRVIDGLVVSDDRPGARVESLSIFVGDRNGTRGEHFFDVSRGLYGLVVEEHEGWTTRGCTVVLPGQNLPVAEGAIPPFL